MLAPNKLKSNIHILFFSLFIVSAVSCGEHICLLICRVCLPFGALAMCSCLSLKAAACCSLKLCWWSDETEIKRPSSKVLECLRGRQSWVIIARAVITFWLQIVQHVASGGHTVKISRCLCPHRPVAQVTPFQISKFNMRPAIEVVLTTHTVAVRVKVALQSTSTPARSLWTCSCSLHLWRSSVEGLRRADWNKTHFSCSEPEEAVHVLVFT